MFKKEHFTCCLVAGCELVINNTRNEQHKFGWSCVPGSRIAVWNSVQFHFVAFHFPTKCLSIFILYIFVNMV